ncbi:HTH-type transcriptional regulator DmlR [Pseudovibrio sp. Ad13]|uniref:LysR family transcriptional regulator n=1 Tax=Pseudovibrio sp. Ad13 TaxID=989396 RepID=UPI0007AE3BD2|nr:LysR family transcriptional regulator [Pseudovibrio sp. Ad13]KZK82841.1 HTH-type transcriptional regulator DmlR [Pseudovibrio sp. Ad13]
MQDLNAIAIFAEVAKAGSFSGAAKVLRLPLSTVSRKVADLEAQIGAKLLERTTRRMRLTEIGDQFYQACLPGLEAFKAADRVVEQSQSVVLGDLKVTVPPNLAEALFIPVIGQFRLQYPQVRIHMIVSERNLDFIEDDVDLSFRVGPKPDSGLTLTKLAAYRHVLVASPSYIAEQGTPQRPEDLMQHALIGFGFWQKPEISWQLSRKSEERTIRFAPDIAINDYSALQSAIKSGLGIGELPSILCQDALKKRSLVEVLPEWRFPEIDLHAMHTGKQNQSRLTRLFLETCVSMIRPKLRQFA